MSAHTPGNPLRTALAVAALAIFHSATPLAVSAQTRAAVRASATVVHADAAWTAHDLTRAVLHTAAGRAGTGTIAPPPDGFAQPWTTPDTTPFRTERNGTVVWVRPATGGDGPTLVTVAHLGS